MPHSPRPAVRAYVGSLITAVVLAVAVVAPQSAPSADQLTASTVSPDDAYWTQVSTASASSIRSYGMDVASDGAVITTGSFSGQAVFPTGADADDSIVLTSSGSSDIFVAGFDPATGYFTWAQRAGGTGAEESNAIAVRSDDTVVLTGQIAGSARFPTGAAADDSIVLTSNGGADIFVAALDSDTGYFVWAQRAGGGNSMGPVFFDVGNAIASIDDTIIVTGEFEGTATFPRSATTDDSVSLRSDGISAAFVASVNPATGYFVWAQKVGGASRNYGQSVAITSTGQPIVTGSFTDLATFPKSATADDSFVITEANTAIFVAAMNADDSYFAWAQKAGGGGNDRPESIALTTDDTPIITGSFRLSASFPTGPLPDDSIVVTGSGLRTFIAALNADDSYFAWVQSADGADTNEGKSVAVSFAGSPVVTGLFQGSVSFPSGAAADDSISLISSGLYDAYVAGFDPVTGYFTWAQRAGGPTNSTDAGRAVAVLGDDTPVVAGNFVGSALFPSGPTTNLSVTSKPTLSNANMFIGLIGPAVPNPDPDPPTPAPVFPPSAPVAVIGEPGDASSTVRWGAPGSAGSFPITTYQAQVLPGGQSCLVSAPSLSCDIPGLVNGVTYTASVRALNGAGWGPFSAPSDPFTPTAPVVESIVITGSRGEVRGRPGVIVRGVTTGMPGQVVTARVRFPGQTTYATGSSRTVSDDGTFSWQRRTAKKVYVVFEGDTVRSNRLIIRTR